MTKPPLTPLSPTRFFSIFSRTVRPFFPEQVKEREKNWKTLLRNIPFREETEQLVLKYMKGNKSNLLICAQSSHKQIIDQRSFCDVVASSQKPTIACYELIGGGDFERNSLEEDVTLYCKHRLSEPPEGNKYRILS